MERQKKKQKGITLIALVISIIVMLILAGVSLNMTVGENGIIKQAQNATYETGMAALEEWLQLEYVKYYGNVTESDQENEVAFLNRMFNHTLLLKDGSRDYIINEGKVYYLLNKSCSFIPKEIKEGLVGGDTTEYIEYTRLQDVYGITKDLKVYYCGEGIEGALGSVEAYDIDPNASATGVNGNPNLKNALSDILSNQYGVIVDEEKGVTLANASVLKDLELDGNKYSGITNIAGLGDLKNLRTLTLTNMNLTSLNGLEGIPNLYYLYLKNTTVGNFTSLESVINLQYLYIYMPSSINEETANNQVVLLGQGLKNASELTKLEYFGISGDDIMYDSTYTKYIRDPSDSLGFSSLNDRNMITYNSSYISNVSSLGEKTSKTGLFAFNDSVKKSIKYLYLNNNKFSSIEALSDFNSLVVAYLSNNSNLTSVNGLENKNNLQILTLQYCNLQSLGDFDTKMGLYGCSNLEYLSIQYNVNLTSLNGLKDSKSLIYLIAAYCNITDITELNSKDLTLLNMKNNLNLENVLTLGNLTGIKKLYLAMNEKMIGTEIKIALDDSVTHILRNCGRNYSLPEKYMIYFSTVTRYDYTNKNLTDSSDEILALETRTDLELIKFNNNSQLSYEKISKIVKNNKGLKYLSLYGCSQINSIEFLDKLNSLQELDLRGISTTVTDLSNLNTKTSLRSLYVSNPSIDLTKIQDLINTMYLLGPTVSQLYGWANGGTCGIILEGNQALYDFSKCSKITNFYSYDPSSSITQTGTLDLSGTKIVNFKETNYHGVKFKLPSTVINIGMTYCNGNTTLDLSLCSELTSISGDYLANNSLVTIINTLPLNNLLNTITINHFADNYLDFNGVISKMTKLKALYISGIPKLVENLDGISGLTSLETLSLSNFSNLDDASGIENLINLKSLTLVNMPKLSTGFNLEELSLLTKLKIDTTTISSNVKLPTNLTSLTLTNNRFNNLIFLSNIEGLITLKLSNNSISNLTPLVDAIGTDNKIGYTELNISNNSLDGYTAADNITALLKLHAAGLQKVYVTGNNFSANEINELINGKTVTDASGNKTNYAGFGSGNVIN